MIPWAIGEKTFILSELESDNQRAEVRDVVLSRFKNKIYQALHSSEITAQQATDLIRFKEDQYIRGELDWGKPALIQLLMTPEGHSTLFWCLAHPHQNLGLAEVDDLVNEYLLQVRDALFECLRRPRLWGLKLQYDKREIGKSLRDDPEAAAAYVSSVLSAFSPAPDGAQRKHGSNFRQQVEQIIKDVRTEVNHGKEERYLVGDGGAGAGRVPGEGA